MSNVNRRLNVKYFAKAAPKVNIREYSEIIREYEKTRKLPSRLEIMGVAIDDSMNANLWKVPSEDLDEIASRLKDVQVRKNHSDRVEDIIGVVKDAWREDNKVFYVAEIADEEIIKKMLLGYIRFSSIQVYSDDVYCARCLGSGKSEREAKLDDFMNPCPRCGGKELIIRHPIPIEISIVSLPAYENAIVMPIGFKAALDMTLREKFKYDASVHITHDKNEATTFEEKGGSGKNASLPERTIMSFKAQDTAAPSAEIKESKPLSYEDVIKLITDSQKQVQDYFDKAIKALQEEVKKLTEEVKKTKKEEEEEEEEVKKEDEEAKKKLEARLKARAKIRALIAKKRREELRKKIEERRKKKEEEEAKKKKIEELKKKLEEVKKKIEEAKKAKKVEASYSGKGVVGEVKEESGLTSELPEWMKEILGASKKTGFLMG